jgi:hypothetical protein
MGDLPRKRRGFIVIDDLLKKKRNGLIVMGGLPKWKKKVLHG